VSDGSRRWVTLAACVAASVFMGFGYTWSVYLKPMAAAEGWSSADVALSYTALMSTAAAMAIASGWALRYLQPRTLVLLGGVLLGLGVAALGSVHSLGAMYGFAFVAGMGMGIIYPGATMANLIRFFPDRGGFASGFLTAGAGIGGMLWGPVAVLTIEQYGLSWALRIMGASFFVAVAICSRLIATAPEGFTPAGWSAPPARQAALRAEQKDWRRMLRTPVFYLLFALFLMGTVSGMLVIGQGAPIVEDTLGASARAAGVAVTLLALGMVLGKVAWGWLSDRVGRPAVLVLLFVVATAALLVMTGASSYGPLVLGMSTVAFCYGGFVAVMGPVTADAFGVRHLGVNFGIVFLSVAVAAYVGPQLASRVAEASGGDYTVAFVVAAAISGAGLLAAAGHLALARRKAVASPDGPKAAPPAT
jgi:MFS transporter, OFA family, oxalate/formate antiporter